MSLSHWKNRSTDILLLLFIISNWSPNAIIASEYEPINDPPLLDCSKFALNASSKNVSLQKMNYDARLHACFEANPYHITQLPVPLVGGTFELEPRRRLQQQQLTPVLEIDYHFGVIYAIAFDHGEISLLGSTSLGWTDGYRAWNKSQIPIDYVQLPLGELWYPQLLFVSTIRKRSLKLFEPDDLALIYSDGYVSLIRRNVLEGHCLVDYVSFPFDRQICQIQFSLERYFDPISDPGFDVALVAREDSERKLYEWFENEQWDLVKVTQETRNYTYRKSQHKSQKPEPLLNNTDMFMTGFVVNITLRRHPQFYVVNILIPILVLSVMGQTAFAVPEHSDAKIAVPLTVLLGFMFVQGIVASELPRSERYSLLAVYILACEVLTGLNCIMCSLCMWLALNGVRVSLRASRVLQFAASLVLLRHASPTSSLLQSKHANNKCLGNTNHAGVPNDQHLKHAAGSPSGSTSGPTSCVEATYQQSQQEAHVEATHESEETRRLTEPNAVEMGEMLAILINRFLAVFHLAAITLLFVSLIFVPLILLG